MNFRFVLCSYFLLILFNSCISSTKIVIDNKEIGALGPVITNKINGSGIYFLVNKKSPEKKVDLKKIDSGGFLNLYPTIPLTVGESYQLKNSNNETVLDNIHVRKPCLIYLSDPNGKPEIWKKCEDGNPVQITETGGRVQDFTVSWSGDKILFSAVNNLNSLSIWQIKPDESEPTKVFDCLESICTDLVYSPMTNMLGFIKTNDFPQIKLLNLNGQSITNIQNSASDIKFSPNGQYLSFLNYQSSELSIINLSNMKRIVQPSSAGLVGDWSNDSQSILFGQLNFWGGIPDVNVYKFDVETANISLLFSSQDKDLEYLHPSLTDAPGTYLVSVRQSNSGSGSQLWLINSEGMIIKEITKDPLYHYSFFSWNSDNTELVYQRYPINTSSGSPQIVTWDKKTDSFSIIANNAVKPYWLP
jgi:dipeptidyl aminopeptidase/acylaminoacyl peptidase